MPALGGQCFESANDNDQRNEDRFDEGESWQREGRWLEGGAAKRPRTKPHLHDNSINTHGKFGSVILL